MSAAAPAAEPAGRATTPRQPSASPARTALDAVVSRFDPVSLDELVAEAELLTRVDRKYLVPAEALRPLLLGADPACRVLEIDGARGSRYSSTYFDTPDLLSYRLAAHGRRRRFKLRSRHYVDTGAAFLEMKTKGARGATVKERIPHPADQTEALTAAGRAYAAAGLEALGLDARTAEQLIPVLRTGYRRTTLLLPDGGRATIDTELEWADAAGARMTTPRLAIVETKSASKVSSLDRLLRRLGIRPRSVSKFATGLAALRPELPANKWARVIRTHFDPAGPHIRDARNSRPLEGDRT